MYDPHEENEDANNQSNVGDDDSIDNDAAQHMWCIEAEVHHHLQLIASHREADKHIYDSIVEDEKLQITLLPQTTRIMQRQWQQLYDAEEHKLLQQAIIDELNQISISQG